MVMKLIKLMGIMFLILVSMVSTAQPERPIEIIASVDKNPVIQGEPFILTITVDDDVSEATLNIYEQLSGFHIISTGSSKRTSVINGVTTRTTSFVIHVQAPETLGPVVIPPIAINGSVSNEIELKVIDAKAADEAIEQRPAFIRTAIETNQVYVQQQFKLVARLYLSANLHSGNLSAPSMADADVAQFGNDEESYEIIDGKRYHVFQRTYLITPQRSGTYSIDGPIFNGQISRDATRSLFSSIATTQPVSAKAPATQIDVLPRPGDWQGHWLPAELVTLTVEQANPDAAVSVGQPLTLTYRLTAIGVNPEQLPNFNFFDNIAEVSVYPEAPELGSTVRNGRIIAQRSQTIAVIPRTAGALTLPAATIPWFNTRLGTTQLAQTDPITIDVASSTTPLPELSVSQPVPAETVEPIIDGVTTSSTAVLGAQVTSSMPMWLSLFFGVLWLITLVAFVWLWRRTRRSPDTTTAAMVSPSGTSLKEIQQAAQANDAKACEQALRQWGRNTLTLRMDDLLELAEYFQYEPLTSQLEYLQECRYSAYQHQWQEGKALLRALTAALRQHQRQASQSPVMQPLYPA